MEMKIAVVGAGGRMGRMLVREAFRNESCHLVAATDRADSDLLGQDAGSVAGVPALGVAVTEDARAAFSAADAVIDFTTPAATVAHAELAAETGAILVSGTTGLGEADQAALEAAAARVPIVWAPNMSLGVNLLMALTEQVARALGPEYDIEILEMHHRHKVDAPSGTALGLGRAAAAGRGVPLGDVSEHVRHGHTGARADGRIGFAVLRGGDVVGDHTVMFAGAGERLELTHKASSREIFARGAVTACLWARGRAPGLYGMKDVLGLA